MNKRHCVLMVVITGLVTVILWGIKVHGKPQAIANASDGFFGNCKDTTCGNPFDSIYA